MKILYHPSCLLPRKKGEELIKLPIYFNFEFYLLYIHKTAYPYFDRTSDSFMKMLSGVININNRQNHRDDIIGCPTGFNEYDNKYYIPLFIDGNIKNNAIAYTQEEFLNKKPPVIELSDILDDHLRDYFFHLHYKVTDGIEWCNIGYDNYILKEKEDQKREKKFDKIRFASNRSKISFLSKYLISLNSLVYCEYYTKEYDELYNELYNDSFFDSICRSLNSRGYSFLKRKIPLDCGYYFGACDIAYKECKKCKSLKHKDKYIASKSTCSDCIKENNKIYKAKKYRKKLLISARERLRAKGFTKEMRTENIIEIQALILETKRKLKNKNHVNTNNEQEKNNDPCSHPAGRNSGIKRESRRSLIRYAKSAGSEGGE